jgi:hypothetical protein
MTGDIEDGQIVEEVARVLNFIMLQNKQIELHTFRIFIASGIKYA